MRKMKALGVLLAVGMFLAFGSVVSAATVTLNSSTFDPATEPLTDTAPPGYSGTSPSGSDSISGWTYYYEGSGTNTISFVPGSFLDGHAPGGLGQRYIEKALAIKNGLTTLNLEEGNGPVSAGIQEFNSVPVGGGLYGEVTVVVGWNRCERSGDGLAIVDGTGDFGELLYSPNGPGGGTITEITTTFTPTQPTFKVGLFSGAGADTNANIDYITVSSEAPEPLGDLLITKFLDDCDGIYEGNEPLLPGWSFTIDGDPTLYTTDQSGTVLIPGLEPGPHTITEILQPGWMACSQNPMEVNIAEGQVTEVYFGNKIIPEPATILAMFAGLAGLGGYVRRRKGF